MKSVTNEEVSENGIGAGDDMCYQQGWRLMFDTERVGRTYNAPGPDQFNMFTSSFLT